MPRVLAYLASLSLALFATAAPAASINHKTIDGNDVLFVSGELFFGDHERFEETASGLDDALVVLDSPGGNLLAGIGIGHIIHAKGFSTLVVQGDTCASACGLAWLGGRTRLAEPGSRIGFHAASKEDPAGKPVAASAGNAVIGAYLNQIGLPLRAVVYLTDTAPESMEWLTSRNAERYGITHQILRLGDRRGTGGASSSAAATPSWTGYGEWVQAFSSPSLEGAVRFAETIRRDNPNTNVFQYTNGWYAVVVGPFSPGRGSVAKEALVAAAEVPGDSFVVFGERFSRLMWGQPPVSRLKKQ